MATSTTGHVKVTINAGAYTRWLNKIVQPYLLRKCQDIATEARSRAPKGATGDLAGSIVVDRGTKGGGTVKVNAPHAGFVHQGTGPQHRPDARSAYFPKVRKRGLMLWAMTKGLNPYKVAHGISESGTPANPFLEEAIEKVLGRFHFRWIRKELNT